MNETNLTPEIRNEVLSFGMGEIASYLDPYTNKKEYLRDTMVFYQGDANSSPKLFIPGKSDISMMVVISRHKATNVCQQLPEYLTDGDVMILSHNRRFQPFTGRLLVAGKFLNGTNTLWYIDATGGQSKMIAIWADYADDPAFHGIFTSLTKQFGRLLPDEFDQLCQKHQDAFFLEVEDKV